jgi:hypothetical protein
MPHDTLAVDGLRSATLPVRTINVANPRMAIAFCIGWSSISSLIQWRTSRSD